MEKGVQVRSIRRCLLILQAVNRAGSMTMMEIAQVAEVPYPTACRIVRTLVQEGMLEREPDRKHYRPTVLVLSLSHGYQDHSGLASVARQHLVEFTKKHLWPVSLVTRVGQSMIVRDCTHALSPMALNNYYPGATFPLLECASGHVYLAYCADDEREQLLDAAPLLAQHADNWVVSQFRSGLLPAEIRARGFATRGRNQFTTTPGRTSSIAAPIFFDGKVMGALTMVLFSTSMKLSEAVERYSQSLISAADEISVAFAEYNAHGQAA